MKHLPHTPAHLFLALLLTLAAALPAAAQTTGTLARADTLSDYEREIVRETNLARQHPDRYAKLLEEHKKYYDGKIYAPPGGLRVRTKEGVKALKEAVKFLKKQTPLPALEHSPGMTRGAEDHLKDIQKNDILGHRGSDGSRVGDRVNRYGRWREQIGENLAYWPGDARGAVMQLIIDDGVKDRGHRKNIFEPSYRNIGVACGEHKVYGTACAIAMAAGYEEGEKK